MRRACILAAMVLCACGGGGGPTLTVVRAGNTPDGSVSSTAGIDCGQACAIDVTPGAVVPLTAVVPAGVQFMGFDGGGCVGLGYDCTVTIDADDVTVTATFNEKREAVDIPIFINPDVDVLFVESNESSTIEIKESLIRAFPAMLDVIDDSTFGMPNLHVGVVTPDLGTLGVNIGAPACNDSDGGRLVTGDPDLPNACTQLLANFLSVEDGTANFTGTIEDAFACIARIGTVGCAFQQPLEAARVALDDNPVNAGFVRPSAQLAVVVLADVDDCSVVDPGFFAPASDELGPLSSFRCFENAVRCDQGSGADLRAPGAKTHCVVDETGPYIAPLARYLDFFRALKVTPHDVMFATIAGDATPVEVQTQTPMGSTEAWPDLVPSCQYDNPLGASIADPVIRLRALADAFGATRGLATSICNSDLTRPMQDVGAMIRDAIGYPCLDGELYAPDACNLSYVQHPGQASELIAPLAPCTATLDNPPCWHVVVDAAACPASASHEHIVVVDPVGPPLDTFIIGSCRIR